MELRQITLLALIVFVGLNCRTEEELQLETGKGQYGVVSVRKGEKTWIIGPGYEEIHIVPGGKYFWAKDEGKWGVINRNHERVIPFVYDSMANNNSSGEIYFAWSYGKCAVVSLGEKCTATEAVYDAVWSVWDTKERFAVFSFVKQKGKYGIVSPECVEILKPVYDTVIWKGADAWPDPILYSFNGRCGMINSKGEKVVPLGYDSISVSIVETTNEGARFAYLNDSLAFFNEKGQSFSRKIKPETRADYKEWMYFDASIGCRTKRLHR